MKQKEKGQVDKNHKMTFDELVRDEEMSLCFD